MSQVADSTRKAVVDMFESNEPFTSACISHPLIKMDASIRHHDVSQTIKEMWRNGEMVGPDGSMLVRSNISVWPNGPGRSVNAWLYHTDDYDVASFKPRSRVLVRGDIVDPPTSIANVADGSPVKKQCQVQTKNKTLNVPRSIIKEIGWLATDGIRVNIDGSTVTLIRCAMNSDQSIDKEGRIRLHGKAVDALDTSPLTALLVEPTKGDKYTKYIQISGLSAAQATVDDAAAYDVATSSSVWD